jgi:hypothetical protein
MNTGCLRDRKGINEGLDGHGSLHCRLLFLVAVGADIIGLAGGEPEKPHRIRTMLVMAGNAGQLDFLAIDDNGFLGLEGMPSSPKRPDCVISLGNAGMAFEA